MNEHLLHISTHLFLLFFHHIWLVVLYGSLSLLLCLWGGRSRSIPHHLKTCRLLHTPVLLSYATPWCRWLSLRRVLQIAFHVSYHFVGVLELTQIELLHDVILHGCRVHSLLTFVKLTTIQVLHYDFRLLFLAHLSVLNASFRWCELGCLRRIQSLTYESTDGWTLV